MSDPPEPRFAVRRQPDGSFTASGDQGLAAFTTPLTDGWPQVEQLRQQRAAVDHFPNSDDYRAFCETFGPPPQP